MTAAAPEAVPPRVLHAGCGASPLPAFFDRPVVETRLDIDPSVNPDIVADMTDLGDIGPFDIVVTAHALEHLTYADACKALREFHRVLVPGGSVVVIVPDVEGVSPTDDVLFYAPSGPITGRDLLYGHQEAIKTNPHMQHKTGFVMGTLSAALEGAGFTVRYISSDGTYNLMAVAHK